MNYEEEEPLIQILRRNNRIRRETEKRLRRNLQTLKQSADSLFLELCETENAKAAELAMEKLWTLGKFKCDPLNYDFVVEMCIRALEDSETLSHRPVAAMQKTLERQLDGSGYTNPGNGFIAQGNIG